MEKIRIGIVGYGNIGRGVEQSIKRNDDMELKAVFTRRDPVGVSIQTEGAVVKHFDDMESMKDEIDVMILCGGSATSAGHRTKSCCFFQHDRQFRYTRKNPGIFCKRR